MDDRPDLEPPDQPQEPEPDQTPKTLAVHITVSEPDLVAEILSHEPGEPRDRFLHNALRIGILSLKQARGTLDADTLKNQADRLLEELGRNLDRHRELVGRQLDGTLTDYFDPKNGRFNERVERLVGRDGELEALLKSKVGPQDSTLAKTLAAHVGEESPLLRILTPDESKGIIHTLRLAVDKSLQSQRESILGEFSLNNEDSALSRLLHRVEKSNRTISTEFSLDDDSSALSRLKKELLRVLEEHKRASDVFRGEVREKLEAIGVRRETAASTPLHGLDFEDAVCEHVSRLSQGAGDVFQSTGTTTGTIPNCKVGDGVLTLGPEQPAAGARIVIEAKESSAYDLKKALDEIEVGRKNRGAQAGLFVFSEASVPTRFDRVRRYGLDTVVVWNAEDESSNAYLYAGLAIAKALCTRSKAEASDAKVDLDAAEKAIRTVEKLSKGLDEIRTSGNTIKSASEKILERVRIMSTRLEKQVEVLDGIMGQVRSVVGEEGGGPG